MVELGEPKELTVEQQGMENAKNSILIIERFVFALGKVQMPLQFAEEAIAGVKFLQAMHDKLLGEIGPEEVEKMKARYGGPPTNNTAPQPLPQVPGLVNPDGSPIPAA